LGGAEQAIFRGFLAGTQDFADVAKAKALVVPEFKNHTLAGSEPAKGALDAAAELAIPHIALGIGMGGVFFKIVHAVEGAFGGIDDGRLLFSHFSLAQIIQANVGHDAVQPSVKTAIEPEGINAAEDAQEGLLKDVTCVFLGAEQVDGEPEHTLVVSADELLEGILIAALDSPN